MDIGREIEIKLDLGSFTNYLKLIGFLGHIDIEEHHVNGFFDTEDLQLSKSGWALRVRTEQSRGLITVKGLPTRKGAATVRQEIEAEVARGDAAAIIDLRADVMGFSNSPIDFIRKKIGARSLSRVIRFDNVRQKKTFTIADAEHVLEIDKTEFSDGSVDYELELELKDTGRLEAIEDHLRRMFASLDIPFVHQHESKLVRALKRANMI